MCQKPLEVYPVLPQGNGCAVFCGFTLSKLIGIQYAYFFSFTTTCSWLLHLHGLSPAGGGLYVAWLSSCTIIPSQTWLQPQLVTSGRVFKLMYM